MIADQLLLFGGELIGGSRRFDDLRVNVYAGFRGYWQLGMPKAINPGIQRVKGES